LAIVKISIIFEIGGVTMTPSKKPFLSFVIDPEKLDEIDDFRFKHRFPTRAEAIKWSIGFAINIVESSGLNDDDLYLLTQLEPKKAADWLLKRIKEKEKGWD